MLYTKVRRSSAQRLDLQLLLTSPKSIEYKTSLIQLKLLVPMLNEFGRLAALSREVIEVPTVSCDFSYYVIDGTQTKLPGLD